MIEHNLIAVGLLYTSIEFDQLGSLLCIPKDKAESIASRMIMEVFCLCCDFWFRGSRCDSGIGSYGRFYRPITRPARVSA